MTRHKVLKRAPPTTSARGTPVVDYLNAEDLAPSPATNKVLATTDGTSTTWIDAGGGGPHTHAWGDVTDKPTTFAPTIGSTSSTAVAGNDARLTDARTPTSHSHAEGDVTGLTSALAGKAASSHGHAIADSTGLQAALDAKCASSDPRLSDERAPTAHTHVTADITDLPAPGGGSVSVCEVDFGATAARSRRFTVVDAAITATSKLIVAQSGIAATGKAADENEIDALVARATPNAGSMTVYVDALHGFLRGKYKLNYTVG